LQTEKESIVVLKEKEVHTYIIISEMEDRFHTLDYIEGFVMMNNHNPINGLKSIPFSSDVDEVVSAMSSSMLLAATTVSNVLYYLEAVVGYNSQMLVRL